MEVSRLGETEDKITDKITVLLGCHFILYLIRLPCNYFLFYLQLFWKLNVKTFDGNMPLWNGLNNPYYF